MITMTAGRSEYREAASRPIIPQPVTNGDGSVEILLEAIPGEVVGEAGYRILLFGLVALSVPAKIDGDDPVTFAKVFDLVVKAVRSTAGP